MSISMPSRAHHVSALLSGVALVLGSVLVAAPAPASADAAPAAAALPTVTTPSTSTTATAPSTPSQHWNYSFTYPLGHASPTDIWNRLHTCFSCGIPITGAPTAFPKVGDVVPFTLNRFGDDSFRVSTLYDYSDPTVRPGVNSGLILTATDQNIGGAGSVLNIDFTVRATDGQTIMTVSANVENDFGSSGRRQAYAQWEHDQWARVADRLQHG
ncbi:hypothetical protein [Curtobacterium sp. MCPF17_021]|uniref:hypothetical protein n=1 Tax=Curtobacterium sp. MCPF17_021 TaxID=2175639 RepID=UPI0015E8ABFA|nr:hypothetical protein [Curtobacterium sp. MCPF17_021]WIE84805.1 hypothetical protein DEJ29_008130 [Curtobacterium sp. MCPF17_021]